MTTIRVGRKAAQVDDIDADLAALTWNVNSSGYAVRNGERPRRITIRMHRVIMRRMLGRELERWELVDHINGDPLDNRRSNLRLANNSENAFNRDIPAHNTTGYKGVSRNSTACTRRPYQASITVNRKKHYLGSYATAVEAARAYDAAARQVAGQFAKVNR